MTMDPDIRDALATAASTMPLDVERRLDELHRGLPRRDRIRRIAVIAVAAVVAVAALVLVSQIRPSADDTAIGSTPSGRIALTRVAFDHAGNGTADVVALDPGSGAITPLSERPADDFFPGWSPDGARLAFTTGNPGADGLAIHITNADGSDPVTIDTGKIEFLSWSPDGGQLAYVHSDSGAANDAPSGLYVVDADGGASRRVVGGSWESVSWSPDGGLLLLAGSPANIEHACPPDCTDLYTVRPDGSDLTQLTDDDTYEHYASWSPDGTRIAFARSRGYDNVDYGSDIYVMDADGGGVTRLTDWSGFDSFPVWSPDGTLLAFASDRDVTEAQQTANADGAFENIGIYLMEPDGTGVRRLIAGQPNVTFLPSSWTP
ncbi:MAG: hypothetical protein ABI635_09315 [Actinomycetota bacterium]